MNKASQRSSSGKKKKSGDNNCRMQVEAETSGEKYKNSDFYIPDKRFEQSCLSSAQRNQNTIISTSFQRSTGVSSLDWLFPKKKQTKNIKTHTHVSPFPLITHPLTLECHHNTNVQVSRKELYHAKKE